MTIATKNGSVILKSGSVAESCGCCGGWQCYGPTSCLNYMTAFSQNVQSVKLTASTSGLNYTRSATNTLQWGYGSYSTFGCSSVWPLYECGGAAISSDWTFASRNLPQQDIVLTKYDDRSSTIGTGYPYITYRYQSSDSLTFGLPALSATVTIRCQGQQLSPPLPSWTAVTVEASVRWFYGSGTDKPLLANFSSDCYGQNAMYPGGGECSATAGPVAAITSMSTYEYAQNCKPSLSTTPFSLTGTASSGFTVNCASAVQQSWRPTNADFPRGAADAMFHFQSLYGALFDQGGMSSFMVEVL